MVVKQCSVCKHWDNSWDYNNSMGVCKATPMSFDAFKWDEAGTALVPKEGYEGTTAYAQDASDYAAKLCTMPNHYCSMFNGSN